MDRLQNGFGIQHLIACTLVINVSIATRQGMEASPSGQLF